MQLMQFSATDWSFFKDSMSSAAYYQQLAKYGYTAVEMLPRQRHADALAAGLKILNMASPHSLWLNKRDQQDETVTQLAKLIDTCQQQGIEQLVIFSGNREGQSDDEGLANCIDAGKRLAPLAQKAGITLILEVFNQFDHKDYMADNAAFGFDFVKAVGSPNVKVLYDIYHMQRMQQNIVSDIVNNLELIAHLHVAGSPNRNYPAALSPTQTIDYATLVPTVMQAGYRGYWGMEFISQDPVNELKQAVTDFKQYF